MSDSPRWIEVIVSPAGETKIETQGFVGPACRDATRALESALGLPQCETLTAAYHQSVPQPVCSATRAESAR